MRWAAILVAGCVLVSAWARTVPLALTATDSDALRIADLDLRAAREALRSAESVYREQTRSDSLLRLLPGTPGLAVLLPPPLSPVTRDSIRAAAARELNALDVPRARLGVFVVDQAYGRRTGARVTPGEQRQVYVGTDSAGVYCFMVGTGFVVRDSVLRTAAFGVAPDRRWDRPQPFDVLGPCAFVAVYGAPGAGIDEWLRRGGFRFADLRPLSPPPDTSSSPLPLWSRFADETDIRGCSGGRRDRCRAFLQKDGREAAGAVAYDLPLPYEYRTRAPGMLLRDLEQQFGTERFARFWASDADFAISFATAFGVDPVDWVRRWSVQRYGTASLGPRLASVNVLLSLLTLGLLMAMVAAVAAHRQV